MSSKIPAASSAGIERKNDSRVAVTRSRPRKRPAEIVAPDRETPGISATHWKSADDHGVGEVQLLLAAVLAARRARRAHITALQAIRPNATTQRLRRSFLMKSLRQQADDADRDRADDDVPAHPEVAVTAPLRLHQAERPGLDDVPDVAGEVDDHRRDRAHLDHRGEPGDRRVVDLETQDLLGDREVAGARDRAGTR